MDSFSRVIGTDTVAESTLGTVSYLPPELRELGAAAPIALTRITSGAEAEYSFNLV